MELPENIETPGAASEPADANAALAAIRALPEAYRETLMLRLVEGLTGPEIAGAHRADARVRAREPAPRHEAAARRR